MAFECFRSLERKKTQEIQDHRERERYRKIEVDVSLSWAVTRAIDGDEDFLHSKNLSYIFIITDVI